MPPDVPARPPGFLRQALQIAAKDLRIEWRSREIIFTMAFLATLVVLIFTFAFMSGGSLEGADRLTAEEALRLSSIRVKFDTNVVSGIIWVAVLFSGTVGLARTFDREREGEAIRSLLLSPVPRAAIFIGKLVATVTLMLVVQLFVVPLCGLFLSAPVFNDVLPMALLLLLGSVGFATVGTIFSAALLRSRSRDVLLSTLLFPVVVPVLLAGARGTSNLLDPTAVANAASTLFWTKFLFVADIVYVIVGLWAFEPIATGD